MSRPASTVYAGPGPGPAARASLSSTAAGSGSRQRLRGPGPRPRVSRASRLWTAALSIATGLAAAAWAVGARS